MFFQTIEIVHSIKTGNFKNIKYDTIFNRTRHIQECIYINTHLYLVADFFVLFYINFGLRWLEIVFEQENSLHLFILLLPSW